MLTCKPAQLRNVPRCKRQEPVGSAGNESLPEDYRSTLIPETPCQSMEY